MAKRRKVWMYSPPKAPKPKVPESVKAEVTAKGQELVEQHLKPPPRNPKHNYLIDIRTKWYRSFLLLLYLCHSRAERHLGEL